MGHLLRCFMLGEEQRLSRSKTTSESHARVGHEDWNRAGMSKGPCGKETGVSKMWLQGAENTN